MSDHLPSLVLLKQAKLLDREPLVFESRNLNERKLKAINQQLMSIDWNSILTSDNVNINFDVFCNTLKDTTDMVAPVKSV